MSFNSIGKILKLTTWGESHGTEIGAVLDGVPSNIKISEDYIQKFLDMRAPGTSKFVTQRKEKDKINILSGVFKGYSTGTPISLTIKNTDYKSKDNSEIKERSFASKCVAGGNFNNQITEAEIIFNDGVGYGFGFIFIP